MPTSLGPVPSTIPTVHPKDSVLTARVKDALSHSPVERSVNIGVDSHQGVVVLRGVVADETQMDLAVFVVQNVPGVSKVDSFMHSPSTVSLVGKGRNYSPDLRELQVQRVAGTLVAPAPLDR